ARAGACGSDPPSRRRCVQRAAAAASGARSQARCRPAHTRLRRPRPDRARRSAPPDASVRRDVPRKLARDARHRRLRRGARVRGDSRRRCRRRAGRRAGRIVNLLAFETSSTLGSVTLETAAGLTVRELGIPREQTERLLSVTDELLVAAGIELRSLDGIAFGRGPGSFTGLRVSVAVAQGFGLASGVPLLPVSSLLCLAERAWQEARCERALVCVDAHMGEVYWAHAALRGDEVEIVGDERLGAPGDVAPPEASPWCAVGNGFAAYAESLAGVARAAA